MNPDELNVIVATDCGSTTTKAILIERKDEGFRQTFRGEAPTTVEAPFEDVTRGVLNSLAELEELSGRKILDGEVEALPSLPLSVMQRVHKAVQRSTTMPGALKKLVLNMDE